MTAKKPPRTRTRRPNLARAEGKSSGVGPMGRGEMTMLSPMTDDGPSPELVVFTGNDGLGCALVATAWFHILADAKKAKAVLATGVRLPLRIHPELDTAMTETGVDLKTVESRQLTPELLASADLVVTLGATFEREFLVTPAPLHREHWMVEPEPANTDGAGRARSVRDLIRSRVAMLVFTEGWGRAELSREAARVTRPRWHNEAFSTY